MFDIIVTALGFLILALGLGSKWLERSPLPATLLALLAGIAIGPAVLGLVDPAALGDRALILDHAARLALGIGLVGVALRVPKEIPRRHWRELLRLVPLAMVLMWGVSTLAVHLILGIPFLLSALIGAVVTATDPIASTPIVTGPLADRSLPARLRHTISMESGANDGLSYLFVFLPFLLLTRPAGDAMWHWLLHTFLWEVGVATLAGTALGYGTARLLRIAEERDLMDEDSRLVYTVALALMCVGFGRLIASDEVLLVFAAGVMFAQVVPPRDRKNEERGQEAVNRFFSIPIFALFGTAIPWQEWAALGWRGALLAGVLLALRRPPALLLLRPLLPSLRSRADALFVGWFGPIAVAAIYYGALMEHRLGDPRIWPVVSLVIFASVIAHGMTAAPLTRLYGRRAARGARAMSQDGGPRSAAKGAQSDVRGGGVSGS